MYRLREIERRDLPEINRWRNDERLIRQLGAPFRYIGEEIDDKWFDNYLDKRKNAVRCAVTEEDDRILGMVSLVNLDAVNRAAEIHIMIGQQGDRGKGAGTFAMKAMLEHAFLNLNLNRVELSVLATNERAIRLYEKLGFAHEGTKRQARYKQGSYIDLRLYAMLKSEYEETERGV